MSSELKLLEKVEKKKERKVSNDESVRFRGVRSATQYPLCFRNG